jgi:FixJ family two-component response regulator
MGEPVSKDHPVIAIVDDDQSVCAGVQRLLRSVGFTTTTFTSGPTFLASVSADAPDCVVLDIRMPAMTGFDVQARLRAMGLALPVIFMSAEERPDRQPDDLPGGRPVFLSKPFDGQLLVDAVNAAIGRR